MSISSMTAKTAEVREKCAIQTTGADFATLFVCFFPSWIRLRCQLSPYGRRVFARQIPLDLGLWIMEVFTKKEAQVQRYNKVSILLM